MPEEQDVTRPLQRSHACEQRALRVLVEIDDDVAAEDRIERSAHRPLVHQVELLERDQVSQLGLHAQIGRHCAPLPFLKKRARRASLAHRRESLGVVDPAGGGRQHGGVQVGGEHLDVEAVEQRGRLRAAPWRWNTVLRRSRPRSTRCARGARRYRGQRSAAARRSPGIRNDAARGRTRSGWS